MSVREYIGVCINGHRSYLRLDLLGRPYDDYAAKCSSCGQLARIEPLAAVVAYSEDPPQ